VAVAREVAASLERLYGIVGCRVVWNCIPTHLYASPQTTRAAWRLKEDFPKRTFFYLCCTICAPEKSWAAHQRFCQGSGVRPQSASGACRRRRPARGAARAREQAGFDEPRPFPRVADGYSRRAGCGGRFRAQFGLRGQSSRRHRSDGSGPADRKYGRGGVPELLDNGREGLLCSPAVPSNSPKRWRPC